MIRLILSYNRLPECAEGCRTQLDEEGRRGGSEREGAAHVGGEQGTRRRFQLSQGRTMKSKHAREFKMSGKVIVSRLARYHPKSNDS